jgi:hypothetical protein
MIYRGSNIRQQNGESKERMPLEKEYCGLVVARTRDIGSVAQCERQSVEVIGV